MPSEGVPKCQRCRRDHKKCSPENRPWPGPKCDRCESYGYDCSENMMARRSPQKEVESARAVNRIMEGLSQAKFIGCHQSISRTLAIRPPQLQMIGSMQAPPQYQSPCAGLFEYLRDVDWHNLICAPPSLDSDPFVAMFRSAACPVPGLAGLPIGKRQMYIEVFLQSQRFVHSSHASPISASSGLADSITYIVTHLQRSYPHLSMIYSFDDLSRVCDNYIRYGSYWNTFRTLLQTDEVLLIDPNYSFDHHSPNTTFESAKTIWLCPDLGLKQFCQKLSGLSQMISDLARTEPNSEARAFLAAKIPDRLEEVLGPRLTPALTPSSLSYSPSYFSAIMDSSPVDLKDGDMYSLSESAGAEESDDSFSLDGSKFQASPVGGCFDQNIWNT